MAQQKVQQIELAQGQCHRQGRGCAAVEARSLVCRARQASQLTPLGVKLKLPASKCALGRKCGCRFGSSRSRTQLPHAPQQSAHSRHQFQHRKRFGQVVVGTQFQAQHAVCFRRAGAHHDHRHVGMVSAQISAHLPAVCARQHHVQQHQIKTLTGDGCHREATVRLAVQAKARLLQVHAQRAGDGVVVFNQQQVFIHTGNGRRQAAHGLFAGGRAHTLVLTRAFGPPRSPPANRRASAHRFRALARAGQRRRRCGTRRCWPSARC